MGYTTEFEGRFELDRPLTKEEAAYLVQFSETRRMKRDPGKLKDKPDPIRNCIRLPIGIDGEYFVGSKGFMGQDRDDSILDYNSPPCTQPGLWCKWTSSEDLKGIEWNGAEKFYDYIEWLQYLIDNFLKPWEYVLSGKVKWQGEDPNDMGLIRVKKNIISVNRDLIIYT